MDVNEVSGEIVSSAMAVHTALGPGLLESAYESCLVHELRLRGLRVDVQVPLPIVYRGHRVDAGYRLDLVVEHVVIVELKAVTKILPIHEAQLLSHLRLSGHQVGLLLNFHVARMKDGIRRMVDSSIRPGGGVH
jgi:GxxExxY protein